MRPFGHIEKLETAEYGHKIARNRKEGREASNLHYFDEFLVEKMINDTFFRILKNQITISANTSLLFLLGRIFMIRD